MADFEFIPHEPEAKPGPRPRGSKKAGSGNGGPIGFEAKLWAAADALRNNMDAAEYKHVVLGLIFLKYISDAFEAKHEDLVAQQSQGADPEDPDEYRAENMTATGSICEPTGTTVRETWFPRLSSLR